MRPILQVLKMRINSIQPKLPPITILGAGGIGCSLAATIHHGGHPVKLVEICHSKLSWALKNGIQVTGLPSQPIPIESFDYWKPGNNEIVISCIKSYNNSFLVRKSIAWNQLITIQNGFETFIQSVPRTGEGIASFIAECSSGTTQVRITRAGTLHLGTFSGKEAALPIYSQLAKVICHPSIQVMVTSNITKYKYTKFLYNCAISPLASGCGVDNGQLLANPRIRPIFLGLLRENLGIMSAAGIELGKVGPFAPKTVVSILRNRLVTNLLARWFQKSLDKTYCSMSCDWQTGETELEGYLGHLIQLAGKHPCPLNQALYDWCKERLARKLPASMELVGILQNLVSPIAG